MTVRIEALSPQHDCSAFVCGVEALERYFRELVTHDTKQRVSNCFVAVDKRQDRWLLHFCSNRAGARRSAGSVGEEAAALPLVPAALIGPLGVATPHQGSKVGGALVVDAALRASLADPAVFAILADAKGKRAAAFYERLGFQRFVSRPRSLFLPVATLIRAFEAK